MKPVTVAGRLVLVAVLALFATGCGGAKESTSEPTTVASTVAGTTDASFGGPSTRYPIRGLDASLAIPDSFEVVDARTVDTWMKSSEAKTVLRENPALASVAAQLGGPASTVKLFAYERNAEGISLSITPNPVPDDITLEDAEASAASSLKASLPGLGINSIQTRIVTGPNGRYLRIIYRFSITSQGERSDGRVFAYFFLHGARGIALQLGGAAFAARYEALADAIANSLRYS